jgi:hypothetical protein
MGQQPGPVNRAGLPLSGRVAAAVRQERPAALGAAAVAGMPNVERLVGMRPSGPEIAFLGVIAVQDPTLCLTWMMIIAALAPSRVGNPPAR